MAVHGPTWRALFGEVLRIGPWRTLKKCYYFDFFKVGTLVGTDSFGNEYYYFKTKYITDSHCTFLKNK